MATPVLLRSPVPASEWDQVYGNGDGQLSLDERGIALTVETVLAKFPMDVTVKTEMDRHPLHPFRAGETYRDEQGKTNIRIYPRSAGMSSELIVYVVGHELGHAKLGHLEQPPSLELELEAERFAGAVLAEFGEDLERVIRTLRQKSGNTDSHGTLEQRIAAIRQGYDEGLSNAVAPSGVDSAPPRRHPELYAAFDRLVTAFDDWTTALSANRGSR